MKLSCPPCRLQPHCFLANLGRQSVGFEQFLMGRFYPRGVFIFSEGEQPTGLFVVRTGGVKIYRMATGGRETIVRIAAAGDLIGHTALLCDEPYAEMARTVKDSLLCFLPRHFVDSQLTRKPALALEMLRTLSNELRDTRARLISAFQKPARARIAEALMAYQSKHGVAHDKGVLIDLALKRNELASIIGIATETLVRELKKIEKEGIIQIEGRSIYVLNLPALSETAASSSA